MLHEGSHSGGGVLHEGGHSGGGVLHEEGHSGGGCYMRGVTQVGGVT